MSFFKDIHILAGATKNSVVNKQQTQITLGSLGKAFHRKCDTGILEKF